LGHSLRGASRHRFDAGAIDAAMVCRANSSGLAAFRTQVIWKKFKS
jgi:hypothetical protein